MDHIGTISLQDLKANGARVIPDDRSVMLIVNSKPKSILVPPEEYAMLMRALEDLEDIAAIEARKNEKIVPFETAFTRTA